MMRTSRLGSMVVLLVTISNASAYQLNQRWTATATNPSTGPQGNPITLTWGIIPDGTLTTTGVLGSGPSIFIQTLDNRFGAGPGGNDLTQRPWFVHFEQSFFRWGELSGITYVYEPNDDGITGPTGQSLNAAGFLGTRADLRIGGRNIDGAGNVLAFNNFPNNGDMVIDTSDVNNWGQPANDFRYLRNLIMHEHGHGMGLNHVQSSDRTFLMEPFLQTNFDGPQFDDILGAQRHYGDFYEKSNGGLGNNTAAHATPLGVVANGSTVSIGTSGQITGLIPRTAVDFISIDDDSDIDFLSFTITQPSTVDLTLRPVGITYSQGPQGGGQSQLVTSQLSDLSLALFDTNGTTMLDLQNATGLGGIESITNFSLPSAGTYFARVTGANNNIQMYRLDVSAMAAALAGDFNQDGLFDCADINSLVVEVAGGTNNLSFDLNNDGLVNLGDVDEWRAIAGGHNLPSGTPYLPSDINLDGVVDGSDFNIWNSNKFTAQAAWCSGDVNADGSIDGSDFNLWNSFKFLSSDATAAPIDADDLTRLNENFILFAAEGDVSVVPEPATHLLLASVLFAQLWLRRGRK